MDTLVLHETRPAALESLLSLFARAPGVQIVQQGTIYAFERDPTLDAIILSPPVAYELYGGGESLPRYHLDHHVGRAVAVTDAEIIDSRQSPREGAQTPIPWILTYPSFKAQIRDVMDAEGNVVSTTIELEDSALTKAEMLFVEFISIFETVHAANAAGLTPKIRRLGCSTELEFLDEGEFPMAITALYNAYHAYRNAG